MADVSDLNTARGHRRFDGALRRRSVRLSGSTTNGRRVLRNTEGFRSFATLEATVRTRFGRFTVDSDTRQLLRDGADIHLSPKAFDLLWALIQNRPKVIDKTELHARIWPHTYVSD